MMRFTGTLCVVFLMAICCSPVAQAQSVYELVGNNTLVFSGCLEPSPCDCPAEFLGRLEGDLELVPLPVPLGPIFEFDVPSFAWTFRRNVGPDAFVTGSGSYVVDLAALTHQMVLDLEIDGIPQQFSSLTGFGPEAGDYPDLLEIDLYSQQDACDFDGIQLRSVLKKEFRRGDCNNDGSLDIGDPISALPALFTGAPRPACEDACDANDDGAFNIADAVYLLNHLFQNGPDPADPFASCGLDPTADQTFCMQFTGCP